MDFAAFRLSYGLRIGDIAGSDSAPTLQDRVSSFLMPPTYEDFCEVHCINSHDRSPNFEDFELFAIQAVYSLWYQAFVSRLETLVWRVVGSIAEPIKWALVIQVLRSFPSMPELNGTEDDLYLEVVDGAGDLYDNCQARLFCNWLGFEGKSLDLWVAFAWYLEPGPESLAEAADAILKGDQTDPEIAEALRLQEVIRTKTREELLQEVARLLPKRLDNSQIDEMESQLSEQSAGDDMELCPNEPVRLPIRNASE